MPQNNDFQSMAPWLLGALVVLPFAIALWAILFRGVCYVYNVVFGDLLKQEPVYLPSWSGVLGIVTLRPILGALLTYGMVMGLVALARYGYLDGRTAALYLPTLTAVLNFPISVGCLTFMLPARFGPAFIVAGLELACILTIGAIVLFLGVVISAILNTVP